MASVSLGRSSSFTFLRRIVFRLSSAGFILKIKYLLSSEKRASVERTYTAVCWVRAFQTCNAGSVSVTGSKATARFKQAYSADSLNVTSRKTLEMVKAGDRWVIVRESTGA